MSLNLSPLFVLVVFCAKVSVCQQYAEEIVTLENIFKDISHTYHKYTKQLINLSPFLFGTISLSLKFPHKHTHDRDYDFIIVGCGTAGSVIANRLSQNAKWNILVLEAGKAEYAFNTIPLFSKQGALTNMNWHYLMEYDSGFAKGMKHHRIGWHSGKAIGGSSVIGDMIYARGSPLDYDQWAAHGNPGWSYREVLPYFLKSEQSHLEYQDSHYHGSRGEMSIEKPFTGELAHAFIEAGGELHYPQYIDYNSPRQLGFATLQGTTHKGRRYSTAKAFIYPITERPNLHVVSEAFVTKILINPETKHAYGVKYEKHDEEYEVHCTKEIILSAGTFNSAKLLILSGIGPREHLHELGITNLMDLPVGGVIYDQVAYMALNFKTKLPLSVSPARVFTPSKIKKYHDTGHGALASLGFTESIAFIKSSQSPKHPDIQLKLIGATIGSDYGVGAIRYYRIRDDYYHYYFAPLEKGPTFAILPILLYPKSKGFLKLHSKDPHDAPLLYGNYFSDSNNDDIKTMIEGVRFSIKLTHTKAFQKYGTNMDTTPVPGCEEYAFDSDQYWECAIRTFSYTHFSPVGTNKMGPRGDPHSVVDHTLKVHGIGRLRVADCSVIPLSLSAHLMAPAMMIGEKASDLIKHYWDNYTLHY